MNGYCPPDGLYGEFIKIGLFQKKGSDLRIREHSKSPPLRAR